MKRSFSLLLTGTLMIASGTAYAAQTPAEQLAKLTQDRTPGAPVNCISERNIDNTRIINKTAIVYKMTDGTIYVNTPTSGTNSLLDGSVMVTNTPTQQLCSIDVVQLHSPGVTWMWTGSVALGEFTPYSKRG